MITFDELVKDYEDNMKYTLKLSSIMTYRYAYTKFIKPYFNNKFIDNLTIEDLKIWWKDTISKGYKKNTLNCHIRSTINVYLNYAVRNGYIKRNPMSAIPKYKKPDEIQDRNNNFWELSEFKQFMKYVDDDYYRKIFYFLFFTGLRISELCALTWKDVDFLNNKLSISKNIHYVYSKGYVKSTPKTYRGVRIIEIPSQCMDILENMLEQAKKKNDYDINDYIFGSKKFLKYSTVQKRLRYFNEVSNVKYITVHGFRHSHAAMLINKGVNDHLIAERLGHSIHELYRTYAHLYEINRKEFANVLNEIEEDFDNIK